MNEQKNKRFYKVISLFIKLVILIFSLYYIWDKLSHAPVTITDFSHLISGKNIFYILVILALMFVNWGVEALKWKILVLPIEAITFLSSLKGVFAGVTVSLFTPNRIGEFAGRVFFLKTSDKIRASVMSMIGSFFQLAVTVITGVLAYYILEIVYYDYFQIEKFISTQTVLLLILLLVILMAAVVFMFFRNEERFPRLKKFADVFKMHSGKKFDVIFYLSCIRYIVFAIQYYLALQLFGITGGITIVFSLIALTFFVTSAIPTFALTEITVRAGAAIYFFGTISTDHSSIIASSLFLWMVNLALPAVIGGAFVWEMKFFKTK